VPELLDILSADGERVLGVKDREAVHRDGDWHQAFHLWVVRDDGVLFQRRARWKESWPGYLDATAAGHLVAGESPADGVREAEEELGVPFALDDLVALGVWRVDDEPRPGFVNREHQHVFAVHDDRRLEAWTAFDRAEVEGLVLVAHDGLEALLDGERTPAAAWDGEAVTPLVVGPEELVPATYLDEVAPLLADLSPRR